MFQILLPLRNTHLLFFFLVVVTIAYRIDSIGQLDFVRARAHFRRRNGFYDNSTAAPAYRFLVCGHVCAVQFRYTRHIIECLIMWVIDPVYAAVSTHKLLAEHSTFASLLFSHFESGRENRQTIRSGRH